MKGKKSLLLCTTLLLLVIVAQNAFSETKVDTKKLTYQHRIKTAAKLQPGHKVGTKTGAKKFYHVNLKVYIFLRRFLRRRSIERKHRYVVGGNNNKFRQDYYYSITDNIGFKAVLARNTQKGFVYEGTLNMNGKVKKLTIVCNPYTEAGVCKTKEQILEKSPNLNVMVLLNIRKKDSLHVKRRRKRVRRRFRSQWNYKHTPQTPQVPAVSTQSLTELKQRLTRLEQKVFGKTNKKVRKQCTFSFSNRKPLDILNTAAKITGWTVVTKPGISFGGKISLRVKRKDCGETVLDLCKRLGKSCLLLHNTSKGSFLIVQ